MARSPTITIFSTNPLGIQVSVNRGPQFSVSGASAPNWSPGASVSGGPTWSNDRPAPNVLAPGANYLVVTTSGRAEPADLTMTLPRSFQWNSMQIYIFLDNYGNVSWVALNDGQCITGGLSWGAD
ncbi:hypothetical protein ASD79_20795 [Caulobacter sp. Root655]|uniref:hypothetical protein n=1 Tax=Caulobacter sp. Root655 TaxID=1736578 RepID=UPI0006F43D72|nr:hypothetical protein [Caulobacter sp. Root655]KRA64005.1 hypothetical protein ASD79_20795 [Caulobacter sp. Root655]